MPDITEEKIEEFENNLFEKTDVVDEIGMQTLVGSIRKGPAPWEFGNCFSVSTPDGRSYRILNFNVENYNEFIRQNPELSGKIAIGILDERHALIIDSRVPKEWFQRDICTVCAPPKYWSIEQRLSYYRDLKSGRRRIKS